VTSWNSVSQGAQKGRKRGAQTQQRLAEAYQAVFAGKPTTADQQIVLADMASYTGFFMYHPKDVTDGALRYGEGMRAAFGRIHAFLTMTPEQSEGLQRAARIEAAATTEEGDWE
jgi:hypothetical protein